MTDGLPDEGAARDALRRAASAAAAEARPPVVTDLRRRIRRRRTRAALGSAGLVAAGLLAVPAALAAVGTDNRGPVVAGPATTASAAPSPTADLTPSPIGTASTQTSPTAEPIQPVTEPSVGTRQVQLFLLRERAGQRCPQVVPVTREVPADGVAKQALRALLDGPTSAERASGLTSAFDGDAGRFRYLKLEGRSARADFTDLDGVLAPEDSCEKTKLLEPMRRTLEQFSWIDEARFSIRGDQRAFYVDLLHDRVPG